MCIIYDLIKVGLRICLAVMVFACVFIVTVHNNSRAAATGPKENWHYIPHYYLDARTGCEYVSSGQSQSSLTPRMSSGGTQICRSTK
jgi:hypothetical protein